MNNSCPRIKTCGKYSGLPFLAEITSRIFSGIGKYKNRDFYTNFSRSRQTNLSVCSCKRIHADTYPRFRYTERTHMRFACTEIENFPQRFPTIPIKSVIFNCIDLSRRLLRVMFPFYKRRGSD